MIKVVKEVFKKRLDIINVSIEIIEYEIFNFSRRRENSNISKTLKRKIDNLNLKKRYLHLLVQNFYRLGFRDE